MREWAEDWVIRSDSRHFRVTGSLLQNQRDQSTLSMSVGSDGSVVSEACDRAAIHDFEDASFGPAVLDCQVTY